MIVRSFDRDISTDGRNLSGIALFWDEVNNVTDNGTDFYNESFVQGSVAKTLKERGGIPLPLGYSHAWMEGSQGYAHPDYKDEQLGTVKFRASDEGLLFESRLFDTAKANQIKEERIDTGDLTGVSIGFVPYQNRQIGHHVIRTEIGLLELSLAESPQHQGAKILMVRDNEIKTMTRAELRRSLSLQEILTIQP